MEKPLKFRHFYRDELAKSLAFTEKERQGIVFQLVIAIVLPLVAIPVLTVLYLEMHQELFLVPVLMLVLGSPIYINKLLGDTRFYKNFKKKIIYKIIRYINNTVEYDNLQKVDDVEYDNARFFDNSNTIIYGDDHVSGEINGVRLEWSELLVEYRSTSDKKEFGSKYQFRGLYFVTEFKRDFPASFVIYTPNVNDANVKDKITDNSDFNASFKCKAVKNADKINQVLTPAVISAILQFQKNVANEFMISVMDNRFYLAVYHDEDLFEPTLFQGIKNYDKINGYFEDLYFPMDLLDAVTTELKQ
ncbi:MAG: DUF3137 domain-containing protein [Cytophagales bacterium]|nr:DUF3137 domain-containing protein [Cytophagales bacterium]